MFEDTTLGIVAQCGGSSVVLGMPAFQQIGTDGGLLPAPVELRYLLLGPAERFDIVVDFSDFEGKSFALINDAPAPYTMGGQYLADDVMLFKVTKPLSGKDTSSLPDTLVPFEYLNPTFTTRERQGRVRAYHSGEEPRAGPAASRHVPTFRSDACGVRVRARAGYPASR